MNHPRVRIALARLLGRRPRGERLPLEERYREAIARHVPGRTFADVGCMWRVNGAYAFFAAAHGARSVVGFDTTPATPEFHVRNAATDGAVRFVQGDINDPRIEEVLGRAEVVFCAGVLHHMPEPLLTLRQLRRMCEETLILGAATTPERAYPQAAVFLPHLDAKQRAGLLPAPTPHALKRGLDTAYEPERGYGNWFWLPTPGCVRAMLRVVAFEVVESYDYPRAICVVARAG